MTAGTRDGVEVTPAMLRRWPLPTPSPDGDKEARGRVLIVGGCKEMPGAVILAAIAALRAGGGKLCVATAHSVAPLVAQTVPEARVIGLPESGDGCVLATGVEQLPAHIDALLIGPGMQHEPSVKEFTQAALGRFRDVRVVLDAYAMSAAIEPLQRDGVLLTPHAGEMAHLTTLSKEAIRDNPAGVAIKAAAQWRSLVALKGGTTFIATPHGELWRHDGDTPGLATSGSGDVLAGLIVGLLARGATLEQAAVWGVALHARAGRALEQSIGTVGYLARELLPEIPRAMDALASDQ
jgi:hydroxyethylthiazole kinase-like uncharacterized protein yjeF